jgi:hypothetical protein
MILDKRPAAEIKRAAKDEGMIFLREAAIKKVISNSAIKDIVTSATNNSSHASSLKLRICSLIFIDFIH